MIDDKAHKQNLERLDRLDGRLERIETKLDSVVEIKATMGWLKLAIIGAWGAIVSMLAAK